MKKLIILLALLMGFSAIQDIDAARRKRRKARTVHVQKPVKLSLHDQNPYLTCEDTCAHIHGIDVSHYQHEVFWETIGDNTNMAYVYLKATEGVDRVDERFERNIDMAHRHGLKVGSYHFYRPKLETRRQMENFKNRVLPGEQDLIPMLDVETLGDLPVPQFCDSLSKMLTLFEETYHQKPLVYTYRNFYNKYLQGRIDGYPLMIATYADEQPVLDDGRDYLIWQYTCKGRLNGVSGEVDKSRFVGDHSLREIRFQR